MFGLYGLVDWFIWLFVWFGACMFGLDYLVVLVVWFGFLVGFVCFVGLVVWFIWLVDLVG
jgi:hypothetical protein